MPKVELPGVSTGCFDSDRGDLSFDSVPKVESPGVSTGRFDSDQSILLFDSVPKEVDREADLSRSQSCSCEFQINLNSHGRTTSTIVFPNLRRVVDTLPPDGNSPRHEMAHKVLTTEHSWNKEKN